MVSMKRIVFLRHPPTALNADPVRLRGALDVALAPDGYRMIPDIVERFNAAYPEIDCIYSSPLMRAKVLAHAVSRSRPKPTPFCVRDGLTSWDYGPSLNGQVVADVLDRLQALGSPAGRELAPPGGESMNALLRRLGEALRTIVIETAIDGTAVVVTHLQNCMMGRELLAQSVANPAELVYSYSETSEIKPGEWLEMQLGWRGK